MFNALPVSEDIDYCLYYHASLVFMPPVYQLAALCHMVSRQQGWQNRSGRSSFGQTTFLASWSHDTRAPQRLLRIPVWNSCPWDVMYQTSLSANLHVLSISRARRSRKPQSSGSEAWRCHKSSSRQLKMTVKKDFHALSAFDQHYTPLCTAFGSARTTLKDLTLPLGSLKRI